MSAKGQRTTLSLTPEHKEALEALALELLGESNVSLLMRNIAEGRLKVGSGIDPSLRLSHELQELQQALREALAVIEQLTNP